MLGERLYLDYKAQLSEDGSLKTDADVKWKNLIDGEVYGDKVWRGFYDLENKRAFQAYFVYEKWCVDNESQSFGTGEQISEVENSRTVSNKQKRVNAHNKFVDWVASITRRDKVSLYGYLIDKKELFPNWSGTEFCYENIWSV